MSELTHVVGYFIKLIQFGEGVLHMVDYFAPAYIG